MKATKHAYMRLVERHNFTHFESNLFFKHLKNSDLATTFEQEDGSIRATTKDGICLVIKDDTVLTVLDKLNNVEYWLSDDYQQQHSKHKKQRIRPKGKKHHRTTKQSRKYG